jgi:hypothetical protein
VDRQKILSGRGVPGAPLGESIDDTAERLLSIWRRRCERRRRRRAFHFFRSSLRRAVAGLKGCEKVPPPSAALYSAASPRCHSSYSFTTCLAHSLACIPGDLTQSTPRRADVRRGRRLQNAHASTPRTILYYVSAQLCINCCALQLI